MQLLGGWEGVGQQTGRPKGKSQLHECMQTYIQSLTSQHLHTQVRMYYKFFNLYRKIDFHYQSKKATAPKIALFSLSQVVPDAQTIFQLVLCFDYLNYVIFQLILIGSHLEPYVSYQSACATSMLALNLLLHAQDSQACLHNTLPSLLVLFCNRSFCLNIFSTRVSSQYPCMLL